MKYNPNLISIIEKYYKKYLIEPISGLGYDYNFDFSIMFDEITREIKSKGDLELLINWELLKEIGVDELFGFKIINEFSHKKYISFENINIIY